MPRIRTAKLHKIQVAFFLWRCIMREGIIPMLLGTAVTATGVAMRGVDMKKRGMTSHEKKVALGAGLVGLGAAHIILGAIDFASDKNHW